MQDDILLHVLTSTVARFQRWLSPSEGLIRCEPSSTMKGSCDWLFKHEAYRSWLNSAHNEFLWIRGKPGSGKSALSKFLVEQIRENIAFQSRRSIVAAIFFDFRYVLTQEGGSAKGLLLRALLYQILEKDPSILSDFQKSLDLMNPFPERPEDVDDHHYERCLGNALIAASVNAQVFIVIDGLDECTPAVQNDLMACIEPIYKATYFQPRVRIVVTSRWISPMQRVNEKYPTKQIHLEKENTQAIATYCSARLYSRLMNPAILLGDRHPTVPDDARGPLQRLVTEITTRAKGIFLWVRLVVDILVTDFPVQEGLSHGMEEWRKVLQNMPTGLDSLYETLIDRVSPTKILAARHVISWCMYAVRPLTMDELTTAIRYSTERTDSVLYDEIHLQETRPPLERLCWGLLEFVPDPTSHTSLVQLVHSSAKEYLLGVGARHVMPTGLAHTLITKACVDYMDHCSYNELNPQDPLLNYCVFNWGYHAEIGDSAGIAQEFLFDVFYWPSVDRISFWPIMHELFRLQGLPGLPSKSTSFLHVASQYGLCNTIQALPVRVPLGKFLNQADDVGRTPLHYACAYERANIVSLLLRLGADVDAIDKENCTPLHMAVRSGHAGIVRCLLNRGANIGCLDAQRETPLHYAVRKGSTDTVELLLKRGADPNYLDRYGNSILALAAIKGNEAVARLALSLNNTKWPSISYGIALTFAAAFGLSELVRSLLSSKRCVDYRDLYVQQAFIAAIVGASEEIASILIDFGCNPNVHDHQHGQSALSIAAASGNERVVVFLLQNGADVNIRDIQTGRTPVIHAISYGRPIIVRLLVENGARVELPKHNHMDGNDGWIFRIASALIRLCPNSNDRTHKTKKTGGPARQNTSSFTRRQSMRKAPIGQKRSHPDESPDEDDEDSQDERMNGKHKKYKPLPCACPFQKRFPRQHKCQPKANVQRLK
jgi:ankyrin repeat protein